MFTEIRINKNKIEFGLAKIVAKAQDNPELTKDVVSIVFSPIELDMAEDDFRRAEYVFSRQEIMIPDNIKTYEGQEWSGTMRELVAYINGDKRAVIGHYKNLLMKTDYIAIRDCSKKLSGNLTQEEEIQFLLMEQRRQSWRDAINEAEAWQ